MNAKGLMIEETLRKRKSPAVYPFLSLPPEHITRQHQRKFCCQYNKLQNSKTLGCARATFYKVVKPK